MSPLNIPLWDIHACAQPVPSGTEQKSKAKVKEKRGCVALHLRVGLHGHWHAWVGSRRTSHTVINVRLRASACVPAPQRSISMNKRAVAIAIGFVHVMPAQGG